MTDKGQDILRAPRREREHARHRTEALEAAERLLVRYPYSSISVQQIAEEAEFSIGYLYRLFPSKEELFLSLVEARKVEVVELIEAATAGADDFVQELRGLVTKILDWLCRHEAFAKDSREELMILFRRSRQQAESSAACEDRAARAMESLFRRGISQGVLGGFQPELMAKALRALIWGFIADDIHLRKEAWKDHAEIIVQIILRAFAPEEARDD